MTNHTEPGSNAVADALTTALAGNPSAFTGQPSQLRLKLARLLGQDAHTYRADIHLAVTALDENVPGELLAAAPLTAADLQRHAQILAQARGWTDDAAYTAIRLWVHALGIEAGTAGGPPPGPPPARSVSTPSAGSVSTPDSDRSREDLGLPDEIHPAPAAYPRTSEADDASTVLPLDRRLDPMATELPDRSSLVALPPEPGPGSDPRPSNTAAPPLGNGMQTGTSPWPSSSRFAVAQAVHREGFPIGAYYAFRGRNPHLRYAAVAGFAVLAVASLLLPPGLPRMLLLLVLVAAVLVVPLKLVRNGLMIADDRGFRWYAALPKSGPPELSVSWSEVQVAPGNPPRLLTPQGDLWLKGRKGLVEAITSRTSSTRREPASPGSAL